MKKLKQTLFIILALTIFASVSIVSLAEESVLTELPEGEESSAFVTEGKCGNGVFYSLDREGVLTVFGNGVMDVSEKSSCPWREYAKDVKEVVIKSGVKSIGRYAFSDHENLERVTIPDSVTDIGFGAFSGCDKVTVYCVKGSAAEACARAEGISYEYSDGSSSQNGGTEVIIICSSVAVICIAVGVAVFIKIKKENKK